MAENQPNILFEFLYRFLLLLINCLFSKWTVCLVSDLSSSSTRFFKFGTILYLRLMSRGGRALFIFLYGILYSLSHSSSAYSTLIIFYKNPKSSSKSLILLFVSCVGEAITWLAYFGGIFIPLSYRLWLKGDFMLGSTWFILLWFSEPNCFNIFRTFTSSWSASESLPEC